MKRRSKDDDEEEVSPLKTSPSPLTSARLGPLRATWRQRRVPVPARTASDFSVIADTDVRASSRHLFQLENLRRGDFERLLLPAPPAPTIPSPLEDLNATATPQFIAPAHSLKQLFRAPFSRESIALTVHRLGDLLVLDSD